MRRQLEKELDGRQRHHDDAVAALQQELEGARHSYEAQLAGLEKELELTKAQAMETARLERSRVAEQVGTGERGFPLTQPSCSLPFLPTGLRTSRLRRCPTTLVFARE